MNSRQRLLNVFDRRKPDRTPVTLFVSDTDIEDGPPNCVIGERTDDVIADLIRFHEVLGIDIMLRISVDVFEPIAFGLNSDDWQNSWKFSDRVVMVGNFDQVHLLRQGTPERVRKEVFKIFEQTRGDDGFVFSTSDSIVPGTPKENIHALAESALEYASGRSSR